MYIKIKQQTPHDMEKSRIVSDMQRPYSRDTGQNETEQVEAVRIHGTAPKAHWRLENTFCSGCGAAYTCSKNIID